MKVIKTTRKQINHLTALLKQRKTVFTRAVFWKIPHTSGMEDICLKLGRYKKSENWSEDTLVSTQPKSELTLDNEELRNLIDFLSENYEPFRKGVEKYIPLGEKFDHENIENGIPGTVYTIRSQVLERDTIPQNRATFGLVKLGSKYDLSKLFFVHTIFWFEL